MKKHICLSAFHFLLSAFCFSTFLLFSFLPCSAQVESAPPPQSLQKETPLKKKIPKFTVGGGLGFQFGTYNAIDLAPQVGVYATPWLLALISAEYSYMWRKDYYDSHVWGVGAALQPCIIKRIIFHVGYQFTQVSFKWLGQPEKQVQNFHYAVLGAGYKHYVSQRAYIQALILFNIPIIKPTIQYYSYNYYPFFRFGFGIDL